MSSGQSRTASRATKAPPEKRIGPFANGVGATIWLNRIETDQGPRQVRSITVNPRRYLDRESNEWKDAPSFNLSDLPALIIALTRAQEYCIETPLPGGNDSETGPASDDEERY
jgi:hypothetical protein